MSAAQPVEVSVDDTASVELEQAVLGAVLVNNDAFSMVSGFLKDEHFTEPLHAWIFKVMGIALRDSRKVTPGTIGPSLPEGLRVGTMSGPQYLARLAAGATTVINVPDYGRMIFEAYQERQLVAAAQDVIAAAGGGYTGAPVSDQLAAAEARLADIRGALRATDETSTTVGEAAAHLITNAESAKAGAVVIPSTGMVDADRKLGGGYRPSRLIIMAGRPGMGKSVWVSASARRVARQGYGAAIFTLEVDQAETSARIVASELSNTSFPLDYRDILAGTLDDAGRLALREGVKRVTGLPIHIDYATGVGIAEIEARARMVREVFRRKGIVLGAIFIDYLGLIRPADRYRGRKVDELGEIALGAKELAKRLATCVILLSQINRAVEGRDDKRPMLSDLRDSGNIEEHADAVCFLYRDAYYLEQTAEARAGDPVVLQRLIDSKNDLEMIIAKNRLGPTGTVKLWCDVAKNAIENRSSY